MGIHTLVIFTRIGVVVLARLGHPHNISLSPPLLHISDLPYMLNVIGRLIVCFELFGGPTGTELFTYITYLTPPWP